MAQKIRRVSAIFNFFAPALLASTSALALESVGSTWARADAPPSQDNILTQFKKKLEEPAMRGIPTVVRIVGSGSPGSGVIVRRKGNTYTVLTAGHVVRGSSANDGTAVITDDGQEHSATKIQNSPWLDIAAVYFDSGKSYPVAPISDAATPNIRNSFAVVLGYPINSDKAIFVPVQIIQLSLDLSDRQGGYTIGYYTRIPALPQWKWKQDTVKGMSGGPVLDLSGRLIAIHGEADQLPSLRVSDGTLADNSGMSLGIPVQAWKLFREDLTSLTQENYKRKTTNASSEDSLLLKATKAESEGYPLEAISLYSQAIKRDPNEGSLYANRARAKSDMGDLKGALIDYNKAIDLFPNSWQIFAMRGLLRSEMGDHQGAQKDFDRSLSINSTYYKAEQFKIRDLISSGRATEAIARGENYMQTVLPTSKQALSVGSELVRAYGARNDGEKALSLAKSLFDAQPSEAVLALQISQIYSDLLDKPQEALMFLRQLLPRFTSNKGFIYNLSLLELDFGSADKSVDLLERIIRSSPNDAPMLSALCYALQKKGKPDEAVIRCQAALRLEPKAPQSHRYLGLAYSDLNRHQEASDEYSKSLEYSQKKSAIDYLNRAEAQWKIGNKKQACSDYRKALDPKLIEIQSTEDIKTVWAPDFSLNCTQ